MLNIVCKKIGRRSAYAVSFDYNLDFIEKIKKLDKEERKWDPSEYYWEISAKGLFLLILQHKGNNTIFFDFGGESHKKIFLNLIEKIKETEKKKEEKKITLEKNKKEWVEFKENIETTYHQYSDRLHKLLNPNIKLFPHQITAVMYMNKVRNTLISHEMGLGKTVSSILFVEMNNFERVIVLAPNSLKFNYYNEVLKFTKSKPHIVNWNKNKYTIEESKYVIINYEFFNSKNKMKCDEKWKKLGITKIDALVSDECQRLKNSQSNTYKNFKRIFSDKIFNKETNKIFLSGTPAPNRAYELYNVLNQISPLEFNRKNDFYEQYCGMTYDYWNGWGYVLNTEMQKLDELYEKISPYTHRKRKKDVLKDLPDKSFQKIVLEMTPEEEKEHLSIERDTANNIVPDIRPHHLTILMELRKNLSKIKKNKIVDIVEDIVSTGEKVVIVDFFKEPLRELKKIFGDISVIHTGDQTIEERGEAVKEFQNPNSKIKIFLGGLDVTKEGLTLTESSKMFLLTLPFVPGVYDQISDRLHRIGQKNAVNIYIPIFENTIDLLTLQLLDDKKTELSKVMDNEDYVNEMTTDIMKNIFKHLTKKYGGN